MQLKPTLSLTENHLQIALKFSCSFSQLNRSVSTYSSVTISSLTPKQFNYTVNKSSSIIDYIITIKPAKSIINGPTLTYCINLPDEIIAKNNIMVLTKCDSISLMDWYPLSESDQKAIESTKKQAEMGNIASSNGMSAILASSSGIFLFGLMMIEMIYFLKYINVKYPVNALALFENKPSTYILFFHYKFPVEPEDLGSLPRIYNYYEVSPHFLNNVGEILSQIAALLVFTVFLMGLNCLIHRRLWIVSQLLGSLEGFLVWEIVILFIFLSIQKLFFYITCSICFFPPSSNGQMNSIIGILILFILLAWISMLFVHTKNCQNIRSNRSIGPSTVLPVNNDSDLTVDHNKSSFETNRSRESSKIKKDLSSDDHTLFSPTSPEKDNSKLKIQPLEKNGALKIDEFENQKHKMENIFFNNFQNFQTTHPTAFKKNSSTTLVDRMRRMSKFIISRIRNSTAVVQIEKNLQKISFCFKMCEVNDWVKYITKYEALFEDLRSETTWQRYFKLFYYIKQIMISVLVPLMYDHPLPQIILINIIYFGFILGMIFRNPFESKIIFLINVVSELICFSSLVSVLAMAIMDYTQNEDYEIKLKLGWVILYANIALLYWVMATGIIKVIYHLVFKYKQYKFKKSRITPD